MIIHSCHDMIEHSLHNILISRNKQSHIIDLTVIIWPSISLHGQTDLTKSVMNYLLLNFVIGR